MRPDTTSRSEEAARDHEQIRGRDEWVGGEVGDQEANGLLDESRRCSICEHGHGGHVCAWCSGAAR